MKEPSERELNIFGYGLSILIATFVVVRALRHGFAVWLLFLVVFAFALAAATLNDPKGILPFYRNWMRVTRTIGHILTQGILVIFFYLVMGVIGIILRVLRKDLLDRKVELDRKSYWLKRESAFDPSHYLRQF